MKSDLALLLMRIIFGGSMALAHGLPKLTNFSEYAERFGNPLVVLGPTLSLSAAIGAELFCALAVAFGVLTRWAALPVVFTMIVAAFIVHADDPFQKKELALLYAAGFGAIALLGAGKYSVDGMYGKK
jgi:putative oxidoreductase